MNLMSLRALTPAPACGARVALLTAARLFGRLALGAPLRWSPTPAAWTCCSGQTPVAEQGPADEVDGRNADRRASSASHGEHLCSQRPPGSDRGPTSSARRQGRERLDDLRRTRARPGARCAAISGLAGRAQPAPGRELLAGRPDFVTVVLDADGFADLLVRGRLMRRIGDQDTGSSPRAAEGGAARSGPPARDAGGPAAGVNAVRTSAPQEVARVKAGSPGRAPQKAGALGTYAGSAELEGGPGRSWGARSREPGELGRPLGRARQRERGIHLAGQRPVHLPFGMRWGRLHAGHRHRRRRAGTAIRAPRSGPSRSPAGRAATATTPASGTAGASRPATATSRRSA